MFFKKLLFSFIRRPTSHHFDSLSVDIIRTNNVALNTPENMYNGETKKGGWGVGGGRIPFRNCIVIQAA